MAQRQSIHFRKDAWVTLGANGQVEKIEKIEKPAEARVTKFKTLLKDGRPVSKKYKTVNSKKNLTQLRESKLAKLQKQLGAEAAAAMMHAEPEHDQEVRLFNKWSADEVHIGDISLQDYVACKDKFSKYLPHTSGRFASKRFRKAQCPIVERLCNMMMMHGRNNGKKLMTVRIVRHSFEIIHLLTGENPLQVFVNAIINSGPREDSTRIGRQGTVRRQAVDVSPLRRVNQALWLICTGAREAAFRNIKTIAECLADEIINAAKGSSNSYAIKKKDELERVAKGNR